MSDTAEGIGGALKTSPEDFVVEEIPSYEPCGEGEHLYLLVEKRDATTSRVIEHLCRRFDLERKHVGYAGLKDRHAVTRQWLSLHDPGRRIDDAAAAAMEEPWMRVLDAVRHGNKLRRGHLRGNRFRIALRDVSIGAAPQALAALRKLERQGAPNYFGEQRYGSRGVNHLVGRALILGEFTDALDQFLGWGGHREGHREDAAARDLYEQGAFADARDAYPRSAAPERRALAALARGARAKSAIRAIGPTQRDFWVSAFQSAIFDDVLAQREQTGTPGALVEGDVAYKHDNGALFDVGASEIGESLTQRVTTLEVSPSGPLWGPAMKLAGGQVGEREMAALMRTGVTPDRLKHFSMAWRERGLGARRSMRAVVSNATVEAGADERGEFLRCVFDLPPGSYATVVMSILMQGRFVSENRWTHVTE